MGGFTGLFDRPSPQTADLTKNPAIQRGINATLGDWNASRTATQGGLQDFISQYLAGNANARTYANQETGTVNSFYNGDMASQLAGLRARRASAVNNAADVAVQQALRGVNQANVAGQGGTSSYSQRLAIGATAPIRAQAAVDTANQERSDLDYLTGNQIALTGARSGIADRLAGRALVPGQASTTAVNQETGSLAPVISADQANNFYGIYQKPGILDRMQQETQFLQGLQSIMKNQYGTAGEAYGGWAGGGMGGGGGGMGGMMGGGSGFSFRRGGMVDDYTTGGDVRGPGTGTSDSIPARLSDGEYVMPARAVRIPGVLPLLEKIRAMGGEGPTTMESARAPHFANGGLLYADSWGGLGAQALARDQFNEATVSQQQAQQLQTQQFNRSQEDANNRAILNYAQQWRSNQAGGGGAAAPKYFPMNPPGATGEPPIRGSTGIDAGGTAEDPYTFAGGGLVYRGMTYPKNAYMAGYRASDHIPYGDRARAMADIRSGEFARAYPEMPQPKSKFAYGGVVGYADGGPVDVPSNSSDILALLARRAAAEMLTSPNSGTLGQRRETFEEQQGQLANTRADRQLKLNEDYQNWLMKQGTPAMQRSTTIRDAALAHAAEQGISPDDQPELTQGASPEGIALARQRALEVRPVIEGQRNRAESIANVRNQQADLLAEQQQLKDNPPPAPSLHFNVSAAEGQRQGEQAERIRGTYATRVQNNARALQGINAVLSKVPPQELDAASYFDPTSRRYVPAVPQPHWKGTQTQPTGQTGRVLGVEQGFEGEYVGYKPKYPQGFYDRVNQLVSQGADPRDAKTQAMKEWGQ